MWLNPAVDAFKNKTLELSKFSRLKLKHLQSKAVIDNYSQNVDGCIIPTNNNLWTNCHFICSFSSFFVHEIRQGDTTTAMEA